MSWNVEQRFFEGRVKVSAHIITDTDVECPSCTYGILEHVERDPNRRNAWEEKTPDEFLVCPDCKVMFDVVEHLPLKFGG